MTQRSEVTEQSVEELRSAASRFRSKRLGADHLVGKGDFRRSWAKYGPQNTLRVTNMWRQARRELHEARQAARHLQAEVEQLQLLDHKRPADVVQDPADFPCLRQRLAELEEIVAQSDQRLDELQQTAKDELSSGNERLAQLEQTVDSRLHELQSISSAFTAEKRRLDQLRAANTKREEIRSQLTAFVSAVDKELRP